MTANFTNRAFVRVSLARPLRGVARVRHAALTAVSPPSHFSLPSVLPSFSASKR